MRQGNLSRLALVLILACPFLTGRALAAPDGGARTLPRHTLVFFGDSLTAGYGLDDPAEEAYPALIQRRIEAGGLPWDVVNAGLSGATTAGGLRRVNWILRRPADLIVIELGANDGLRGLPVADMRANLQGIIDRIRATRPGTAIVLAGMRMPPNLGAGYVRSFNSAYPDLAGRNGLPLIPFLLEGVAEVPSLNQADGIHPTAEGHIRLAATVWSVLQPLLVRASAGNGDSRPR